MDDVLRRTPLFATLDQDAAQSLRTSMNEIELARGDLLFNEGEPGDSLYIVLRGKVKLGRRSSDGRENLVAIWARPTSSASCRCSTPARAPPRPPWSPTPGWPGCRSRRCRSGPPSRPQIAMQLLRVVARRLRRTNTMLADLIFVDVPGRVAKQLLQLSPSASARSTAASCASRTT